MWCKCRMIRIPWTDIVKIEGLRENEGNKRKLLILFEKQLKDTKISWSLCQRRWTREVST